MKETLAMKTITETIGGAQGLLNISFDLQGCFEEYLTDEYKTFMHMLRVIESEQPTLNREYAGTGRIPYQYLPFMRSFYAKCFFGITKTSQLIQRLKGEPNLRLLCGFDKVPGKASFSRMFSCFSELNILNETLDSIVINAHKGKIVQHVSRDSTAIPAREHITKKKKRGKKKPVKKHGRAAKSAIKVPKPPNVIETQKNESAKEAIDKLNKECTYGCKKNSQGNISFWRGYKLHLDVSDIGFPLSAVVTGANVHDSQLAIPMEKMTEQKVLSFYSLMDSAYDAKAITSFIRSRDRVPIIDPNKRTSNSRPPLDPAKKERYKIRSGVERANSHLKDSLIPKDIFVKGYSKVSFVLMSGVVCLAPLKFLQYFT
jgi:transposase